MKNDSYFDDSEPAQNPYAAPAWETGGPAAGGLFEDGPEAIRRAYYRRERAIKRIAWINLGVAIVWLFPAVGSLIVLALAMLREIGADVAPSLDLPPIRPIGSSFTLLTLSNVGTLSLNVAMWYGLRTLRSWARWTVVGLASVLILMDLSLAVFVPLRFAPVLVVLVGGGFLIAVVIYVLISAPSGEVFTSEYRDAVARTRGMRL
jgi:hypothetical protein